MFFFTLKGRKINLFNGPDDPPAPPPATPPATPPAVPPSQPQPQPQSTYTQAQLNTMIANERRSLQEKLNATTKQLEELRDSQSTTEEQRIQLQSQIEELQSQFQTKEQQQTAAMQKLQKKYETDIASHTESTNRWRSRFENQLMTADFSRYAAAADAFDVDQIAAILRPLTKVVERQDGGKPTGEFTSEVSFTAKGQDGKPVQLKLSIEDAIKAMKEWPEKYGNLFKTKAKGGLGEDNAPTGQSKGNLELKPEMSMEDYLEFRKQQGLTESA